MRHGQHVLVVATKEDVGWQKYESWYPTHDVNPFILQRHRFTSGTLGTYNGAPFYLDPNRNIRGMTWHRPTQLTLTDGIHVHL